MHTRFGNSGSPHLTYIHVQVAENLVLDSFWYEACESKFIMSLFIFGEFGVSKELTLTLGLFPKGLVIFSWRLFYAAGDGGASLEVDGMRSNKTNTFESCTDYACIWTK